MRPISDAAKAKSCANKKGGSHYEHHSRSTARERGTGP